MCAVTTHSSGESKDQEILKGNTPPDSFSSVSWEALDKYIPMLLFVLLVWHGYYERDLYRNLARLIISSIYSS